MQAIPELRPSLPHFAIHAVLAAVIFLAPMIGASLQAQEAAQPGETPRPLITQAVDESRLTILKGNTHPLARPQFDLGTAPASLPMQRMLLVLKRAPAQETALRKLLDDQQDKTSPSYHRWLTPEQYGQQFGPTDTDLETITAWLQSHGFQVGTTRGRTALEFSGTAGQVQEAFHTTMHRYIVKGEQHWANASDPQIPTALTGAVAGIDSLHDFRKKAMNTYVGKYSETTKQMTGTNPQFSYNCQGYQCYGVSPYDFATIYDVLPLWNSGINGTGQTIAIVGRTNINPLDATDFWTMFGLTVPANKLNIILNGVDPGINGDEPEADIDVQWSGAVAPQATIDFVASASTETTDGVDLSAVYIVDNNLAPVMSESYGECELGLGTAGNQFYSSLWEQAAAQGISVFVSSGDNGSAGCDNPSGPAQYGLNVNGIASTAFNAAVGGTDFNEYNVWASYWKSANDPTTQESAIGYIPETTWNDTCTNGIWITLGWGQTAEAVCNNVNLGDTISEAGSGGPSNCVVNTQGVVGSCTQGYVKPTWQSGAGVPNDHVRDLPDISLFAGNGFMGSSYLICQQDQTGGVCDLNNLLGYGGTSVASPAFAGIMSLVNQKTGAPQGVPGFALYKLVTKQANAFHDIPAGSTIAAPCYKASPNCTVSVTGDSYGILSGYSTGSAYDLATGLGSVDANNLVSNWTKATFTATTTSLQLNSGNPVNVTHGTAVPVNIGVTSASATGQAALLVSTGVGITTGQAIDTFTLSGGSTPGAATSMLPGGTYSVTAHYAGDGNYGGSYSSPVSVTVSKENSQPQAFLVTFDASGNVLNPDTATAQYGSPYLLRVNVENSLGQVCKPVGAGATACPSGTVALTNNGTTLDAGTYSLNSYGYTEDQSVQLPGGTNSVQAAYSGDNSFNASTGTSTITIVPASTTLAQPYVYGAAVGQSSTMSVYVNTSSSGAAPSGTVTFYANGVALNGTVAYSPRAGGIGYGAYLQATLTSDTNAFTASGSYAITATYNGDANYSASTSLVDNISVMYPTPFVQVTPSPQTISYGATATLTALVDTANSTAYPTGTVTFIDPSGATVFGPTACTSVKDTSGNFACQAVGTFTVTSGGGFLSKYSGDANYPAAQNWAYINMPDFMFSASGGVQVTAGQSQELTVTFTSLNGLSGTISNFGCSTLPAETTCTFNPTQVTLPANGTVSTTLTVTTTALGQSRNRAMLDMRGVNWGITGAATLLGTCFAGVPFSRRRRGRIAIAFMLVGLVVVLPSCGGGSGGGGGGAGGGNPIPAITSLNPTKVAAGSQIQSLYVNGTNFMSTSTVTYNGTPHNSSLQSPTQIQIALGPSDVAATGTYPVVVMNPSPGGGSSAPTIFSVLIGTPTGYFTANMNATIGPINHSAPLFMTIQ